MEDAGNGNGGSTTGKGTARDVASRAGVSVYTVQRVFSDSTLVAEETRRRVLEAAQEVGYRPNSAARALRTGRSDAIAFVPTAHAILQPMFYLEMLGGVHTTVANAGLDILLTPSPGPEPGAWLQELVGSGKCDAVIMHVELMSDALKRVFRTFSVPVVVVNYRPTAPVSELGFSVACFDSARGIREAVRHLISLGHRDLAYCGGTPGWPESAEREEGFRSGMREAGLAMEERWVVPCSFKFGALSGAAAITPILSDTRRPTAIVCASDDIAAGVITAARGWGLSVPQDLSVVGYDDMSWASQYMPPLTTVRHSGSDLGKAAATLLLARYGNPQIAPDLVMLPTQFVVRESTAPPRSV